MNNAARTVVLACVLAMALLPIAYSAPTVFVPDWHYTNNPHAPIYAVFNADGITLAQYRLFGDENVPLTVQSNPTSSSFNFTPDQSKPYREGAEYTFTILAQDAQGVPMEQPATFVFYADYTPPQILELAPENGIVTNDSKVKARVLANEPLRKVVFQPQYDKDYGYLFASGDGENRSFNATLTLKDAVYKVNVTVFDRAGNNATGATHFIVHSKPTQISLIHPRYGYISTSDLQVDALTSYFANCTYNKGVMQPYPDGVPMATTDSLSHSAPISFGTGNTTLHISCKDGFGETVNNSFSITYDSTKPVISNLAVVPVTITQRDSQGKLSTRLTASTQVKSLCKWDLNKTAFEDMDNVFDTENPEDVNSFKQAHAAQITDLEDMRSYTVFVKCISRAEVESNLAQASFATNTSLQEDMIVVYPGQYAPTSFAFIVESNKQTTCRYGPTMPPTEDDGSFKTRGYRHMSTSNIQYQPGTYTYWFSCNFDGIILYRNHTFTVDSTPPGPPNISDADPESSVPGYTFNTQKLHATITATDNETGIKEYVVSVWQDSLSNRTNITGDIRSTESSFWIYNLNLKNGSRYYLAGTAVNNAGLISPSARSAGITIDTSVAPAMLCNDTKLNGFESDVDCGGSFCARCDDGKHCNVSTDCLSNLCDPLAKTCKPRGGTDTNQSAPTCGDGVRNQASEQCDKQDLGTLTCQNLGFASGTLSCNSDCTLNRGRCASPNNPYCGDAVIDTPNSGNVNEQCDSANLNSKTCSAFDSFTGGTLQCSAGCFLDYSKCSGGSAARCGDGIINQISEECDSADLQGRTCKLLGYASGTLRCSGQCKLDKSSCSAGTSPAYCGDGKIQNPNNGSMAEQCDGADLGGKTCASLGGGYATGTLQCRNDCSFDITACQKSAAASCTNSAKDGYETDVDCGGRCPACDIGKACVGNTDCKSGSCENSVCIPFEDTCKNGAQDAGETDVDCGGKCPGCAADKQCKSDADCRIGLICDENTNLCIEAPPDADTDGVVDDADLCPDTAAGCEVDTEGCPIDPACGQGAEPPADDTPTPPPESKGFLGLSLPIWLFIIGLLILLGAGGYYAYITYYKKPMPKSGMSNQTGQGQPLQQFMQGPPKPGMRPGQGPATPPRPPVNPLLKIKADAVQKMKDQERSKVFGMFQKPEPLQKIEIPADTPKAMQQTASTGSDQDMAPSGSSSQDSVKIDAGLAKAFPWTAQKQQSPSAKEQAAPSGAARAESAKAERPKSSVQLLKEVQQAEKELSAMDKLKSVAKAAPKQGKPSSLQQLKAKSPPMKGTGLDKLKAAQQPKEKGITELKEKIAKQPNKRKKR